MGKSNDFFEKQTLQSRIKTEIVTKYFSAWSSVMGGHLRKFRGDKRIAYLDFCSGPGIYKDGNKSTPIIVLERAVENDFLKNNLVTIFVDSNFEFCKSLNTAISSIPNIKELNFEPKIYEIPIDESLVELLESYGRVPSLVFIDPWGYKGLSTRLINAVIKDWGCDCIFFFNYLRINSAITNDVLAKNISAIFGEDKLENLRKRVNEESSPIKREEIVMQELELALKENGNKYVLQFCFKQESGRRTSHYIVFVTKNIKGYNIMKEIMVKLSTKDFYGEPNFECNPFWEKGILKFLETDSTKPSRKLQELLLNDFAGETITFGKIFDKNEHHVGTLYTEKYYRYALIDLKERNIITVDRKIRKGTFPKDVSITFPPQKE